MRGRPVISAIICTTCALMSCAETGVDRSSQQTGDNRCDRGKSVDVPSGEQVCVYRKPIVIETGFSCPATSEFLMPPESAPEPGYTPLGDHRFEGFGVCSPVRTLTPLDIDFLMSRFGPDGLGWEDGWDVEEIPVTDAIDILWVIDNSGSMCQEQRTLRDNFDTFAQKLADRGVDFHVSVTTTHMSSTYELEPLAKPGRLQSAPQPVPGFDRECHMALDSNGEAIDGDFSPIRETISIAVECMENPDPDSYVWSDADIECALYSLPSGCSIPAAGCDAADPCEPEDLLPPPADYRDIPKTLRAEDYRGPDGSIDVERLKSDFACMSLVGTRGFGIEKGLNAAVKAVSPAMTGGTVEEPADGSAPNHGFLRDDARFSLFFVTDENDCSDDGTLDQTSQCMDDVCDFANRASAEESPLLKVSTLKQSLLDNLAASKGRDVSDRELYVASIHGNPDRYAGAVATETQCSMGCTPGNDGECPEGMICSELNDTGNGKCEVPPTCATSLGIAYSGDRYERFLRQFPDGHFFPQPSSNDPAAPLTGWMCNGDFAPALDALGEFVRLY